MVHASMCGLVVTERTSNILWPVRLSTRCDADVVLTSLQRPHEEAELGTIALATGDDHDDAARVPPLPQRSSADSLNSVNLDLDVFE